MGKSIFDKYSQPRKDPLKALILERANALRVTTAQCAEILSMSRQCYSRRINELHTDEWQWGEIKALCRALKIDVADLREAVRL